MLQWFQKRSFLYRCLLLWRIRYKIRQSSMINRLQNSSHIFLVFFFSLQISILNKSKMIFSLILFLIHHSSLIQISLNKFFNMLFILQFRKHSLFLLNKKRWYSSHIIILVEFRPFSYVFQFSLRQKILKHFSNKVILMLKVSYILKNTLFFRLVLAVYISNFR